MGLVSVPSGRLLPLGVRPRQPEQHLLHHPPTRRPSRARGAYHRVDRGYTDLVQAQVVTLLYHYIII